MHRVRFLNPRSDTRFVRRVEEIMRGPIGRAEELQVRLRETYPAAVVRERGLAGDDRAPIWYVYRDGHWVETDEETQAP